MAVRPAQIAAPAPPGADRRAPPGADRRATWRGANRLPGDSGKVNSLGGGASPARGRRRRHDAEVADEPQQIGALQPEGASGVRAVAARLVEGRLDQPALELRDRAVIAGGLRDIGMERATRERSTVSMSCSLRIATRVPSTIERFCNELRPGALATCTAGLA